MKAYFIISIEAETIEDARNELAGSLEDARESGEIQGFDIIEESDTDPGRNIEGEPVDGEPSRDPDHFEVSRTHPDAETFGISTVCEDGPDCKATHLYSVYVRKPVDGGHTEAAWLSDHAAQSLAELAAAAYEPAFEEILAAQH